MEKLLLLGSVLCILLHPVNVVLGQEQVALTTATHAATSFSSAGAPPPTYPDITFWLNFEENDTTGDYNMGASECSDGDTSGAYANSATLGSTTPAVGSYYLHLAATDASMTFTGTSVIPGDIGRIGLWVRINTWVDGDSIIRSYVDGNNLFMIQVKGTALDIEFRVFWRYNMGTEIDLTSTAANCVTGTWYFLELSYNATTDDIILYVNGVAVITSLTTAFTSIGAVATLYFGYPELISNAFDIDNVMISKDATFDFCGLSGTCVGFADDTSKPNGCCNGF